MKLVRLRQSQVGMCNLLQRGYMDKLPMDSKIIRPRTGPQALSEEEIQNGIIRLLIERDWFVKPIVASQCMYGWPDLYAASRKYGARWIEVKKPVGYSFTPAQLKQFPEMVAAGIGIWILTEASIEGLKPLFSPPNLHLYLSSWTSYKKPRRY